MVFNLTPERWYQSGTIMYLVGDGLKALLNVFFSTLVYQIQVLSRIVMMDGNRISSLIQIKIHVCRYSINFWNKIIMMWRKLFEEQAPYQGGKCRKFHHLVYLNSYLIQNCRITILVCSSTKLKKNSSKNLLKLQLFFIIK